MADVVLFHHVQGLTEGVLAFAGELRAAGHTGPGDRHLFIDSSLPSFDAPATALVLQRSRRFLDQVG